jgi:hypothetical protein
MILDAASVDFRSLNIIGYIVLGSGVYISVTWVNHTSCM